MSDVLTRIKRAVLVGNYAFSEKAIQSTNLSGLAIYSKGKLVSEGGEDTYYFLISSKRAL